jgi:mannose-6-phosphate isomerase
VTTVADSPLLLRPEPGPTTLKEARWGGTRLAALRGGPQDAGRPIGESWELSTLPGSISRSRGQPLTQWLPGPLPFLVKLIDTAKPLSIQVHPTDGFRPGALGKEEAWVILDAAPGAGLLAGVREGVTREELEEAMANATADPSRDGVLIDRLHWIEVQRGMCIMIPAGTVHAIGPDILLMEIQQPVDCTFRLFDYGSGRPLHPADAIAATDVSARAQVWSPSEAPTECAGRHVGLWPRRGTGPVAGGESTPRVIVAVDEELTVHAGRETEHLAAGDLVLVLGAATVAAPAAALWVEAGLVPNAAENRPAAHER